MCCDGAAKSSSRNSSAVGGRTGACAQPASSEQTMIVRLRMATKLYAWAMFRPNALKARLRTGKRALGCWTVLGAPPVIELLALCGFDYLLLDQEHGFGEPSALLHSLQAMAATPHCTSVVRVPSTGATWREMFQRGYHMINAGSDVGGLRDGALADVKEFRGVYP